MLIDESGCPGFKLTKGSTPYFVVGMVIFKNFRQAEAASKAIAELRQTLKINPEFKFSKTHAAIKDKFFEAICKFDFEVRALVVNKRNIYSSKLRTETDSFYNYFVKSLMQHDNDVLQDASIKIDGSGDKEFKKALSLYLRKSVGEHKIKKFKFTDSRSDNLIQLADMVVGAIARSYSEKRKDANRWLDVLKKRGKIKNIWDFK
ncbi:MAG: DUF3800 domain-containing protein [Pseudomonadota bacterium]